MGPFVEWPMMDPKLPDRLCLSDFFAHKHKNEPYQFYHALETLVVPEKPQIRAKAYNSVAHYI